MQSYHEDDEYLIGTFRVEVSDEPEIVAIYQRLADAEAKARAARSRPPEPSEIADFQSNIKDRLEKVAVWHIERGEVRDLGRGDGWLGLDALDILLDAIGELPNYPNEMDDGAIDFLIDNVDTARSEASGGAEEDMQRDTPHYGSAFHQCIEVQEGNLWRLIECWEGLESLRRKLRDGQLSEARAWMAVAEIMKEAPPYPEIISDAPVISTKERSR